MKSQIVKIKSIKKLDINEDRYNKFSISIDNIMYVIL